MCTESLMKTAVCSICKRDDPQVDLDAVNNEEILCVESVNCGRGAKCGWDNYKQEADNICIHCVPIFDEIVLLNPNLERRHLQNLPRVFHLFSGEKPTRNIQPVSNRSQSTCWRP